MREPEKTIQERANLHPGLNFEQKLEDYANRVADILESFTDAFFEVDGDWMVTYWNKEAERLLMRSRAQTIGHNLWEMYADAIPLKFYTEYHRAVKDNVVVRFEEYFAPRNLWLEVAAFPSVRGLSVYFKDITLHKQALAQLQSERQKYADLFNLSSVSQWVYDSQTLKFLDVNVAAILHYGYTKEEFMLMTIEDIQPGGKVEVLKQIQHTDYGLRSGNQTMVQHKKKDGTVIHVCLEVNTVWFGEIDARLMTVIDRTNEIETQKILKNREQRFRALVEHGSDMIAILDREANCVFVSDSVKSILGINVCDFLGGNLLDYLHPDDKNRIIKLFGILRFKKQVILPPFRFRDFHGNYRWMETILTNMLGDEAVEGIVSNSRDITQRIENELKTEESIARFNTVSKATSDAIWDWNIKTDEMSWNKGMKGIFGHRQIYATREWWKDHVHPEDLEGVLEKFSFLMKQHQTRLELQYRFRCADGSYRFVLDRSFITYDENWAPVRMIGSMQDITRQINYITAIEAQNSRLREISWIQSHKIRSPLASILGLVEILSEPLVELSDVREVIPYLKTAAKKLDEVLSEIIRKAQ